jgi:hypothetical protein
MYMYVFRLILNTWLHTKLLYEGFNNVSTLYNPQSTNSFLQVLPNCICSTSKFVLMSSWCKLLSLATLQSYTTHIWTWIDLKFWCNIINFVCYHLLKFQFIWLYKMKDLATSLKPPQIVIQTQNDLQLYLNNSKPLEIWNMHSIYVLHIFSKFQLYYTNIHQ